MKSSALFGILFPEQTLESVIQKSKESWALATRLRIVTVNPEFLVAAEKNPEFKKNIQQAELLVVDGIGLWGALRLKGWRGSRITGVNIAETLLSLAETERRTVLVVLKKGGLSSLARTKEVFLQKYLNLKVTVLYDTEQENISSSPHDLILIATGVPSQEYLAQQYSQGIVVGVGGTIDFLTGAQKRAPKIIQLIGLEWLWRLLLQPSRFKRIWNAVIIFPLLVIFK